MLTLRAWRDRTLLFVALAGALLSPLGATAQVTQLRDAQGHPYQQQLGYDNVTGLTCVPGLASPTCIVAGGSGGGGGGGASTIADGADVAEGAKADAACATSGSTCNAIQILKGLLAAAQDVATESPVKVADGSDITLGLTTAAACATDNGNCAVNALIKRTNQNLTSFSAKFPSTLGIKTAANSLSFAPASDAIFSVSGTFWQTTQPVSGTFWQTTQPVSGTFWQATQPVSGTFWQATQPISGSISNTAFGATVSGAVTGPTSTLTMTSATTAVAAGNLIATSATAGSVVVPSFSIANSAGGAAIGRLRLYTNDATSTAWGGVKLQVDLWLAAPTFTNGDRGAFLPATGTANHLAAFTCTMSAEYGDGAYAECVPNVGSYVIPKLASGTSVFWTLQAVNAGGVTGASKVWTLAAEELN